MNTTRLALCVILLSACGSKFVHPTPTGFVELDGQHHYDYRAVTADGLVLAARAIPHEPRGEISFWKQAIANHMRRRGGYALLDERDVQTKSGLKGKQLRFGHDEGRTPHLYYVTLFVTDDDIYLLEAGGTKKLMESHADQIDWAVAEFRVD